MVKRYKKEISLAEKKDRSISFAIILQFCMLISNYTFKHILNITNPSMRSAISAVFMLLVGIVFLANLRTVLKRIWKLFIGVYCSFIFIILFNLLLFNQNLEYILDMSFYIFLICIPIFLYYFAINDKSIFLKMLIKSSYYQMSLAIIFFITTDFSVFRYDMVYSYLILVPIIILLYKVSNEFKVLDICLIIFGIFSIVALGSRGPLLSLILYCLVLVLNNSIYNKKLLRNVIIFALSIVILILFISYYKDILLKMDLLLNRFGVSSSRTMIILLDEGIDFSTGRNPIYKYTIEQIINKPILGYGLAGDRIFLDGTYPHNIFLEIFSQFGIIIGGLIIIVFIFYWFSGIMLSKNKVDQELAIMFFGIGLVQLLVSGSYITSSNFWLFMSICINSVHSSKGVNKSKTKVMNEDLVYDKD